MAKINVKIIDPYTLELENDAKKGDLIDLKSITSIDTHILVEKIAEKQDHIYEEKLKEALHTLELKLKSEFQQETTKLNAYTQKLQYDANSLNAQHLNDLKEKDLAYQNQIKLLNSTHEHILQKETADLKHELLMIKERITAEQKDKYLSEIQHLNTQIQTLNLTHQQALNSQANLHKEALSTLKYEKEQLETHSKFTQKEISYTYESKIKDLNQSYLDQIHLKDQEIDVLKRDKSTLNVKKIGENLEKWCDQEFQNQSLAQFDFITWQKDNEVIKGGKADYIYKVYATTDKLKDEVLTSAVLEMKSEDPTSSNHQSNSKFFKKLNDDRNNKGLEYAILVSELEWETTNDAPIQKIADYDKMYLVRPQYFTIFLNIITTFGLKYKEIFLDQKVESLKFKDAQDILDEFEAMKHEILDNSLDYIRKNIDVILTQSEAITKANNKLLESAQTILNRHLNTISNKLNDFKIKRIASKVDALN